MLRMRREFASNYTFTRVGARLFTNIEIDGLLLQLAYSVIYIQTKPDIIFFQVMLYNL